MNHKDWIKDFLGENVGYDQPPEVRTDRIRPDRARVEIGEWERMIGGLVILGCQAILLTIGILLVVCVLLIIQMIFSG